MERCTITAKEVAKYLGVHADTIYDLVRAGNFPHIRFGRKILFSKQAVDQWIYAQVQHTASSVEAGDDSALS
ncbi:helix-turn-helix domain-containing protein [Radiobacillus sp. PE A8.2]|uniref:helix-turn-helix domain-containing protein n=1 Tax=Radiobacillus sp. PE A8.2 TaxID=3380349 RepID=UPI00389117CA